MARHNALTSGLPEWTGPGLDLGTVADLFEHVPEVAFYVKDRLGRYTAVNRSLVQRTGLRDRNDLLGRHVRDIFPPDLAGRYAVQDEAVLRSGRAVRDQLELHWYANRSRGWCLTTKLPLRDAEGNVSGLVGISRDVRTPGEAGDLPHGVAAAMDWLRGNFGGPVSPGSLAARAGMPSVRFARLTKRLFGLTPGQLIAQTRLGAAGEMLRTSPQTVADIALACGFADHSAFSRAFRAATGMTPRAWRERR